MLISTRPQTKAEEAVILRSRQLTDFKWIPIRDVPTYTKVSGNTVLPAGVEVVGFPYASTEGTDKFFTENVLFESFLTAIANPYSKLYAPGHAALNACNFGVVCNGLARYALGIDRRVSTKRWSTIPGMNMIASKGNYTVDDIKLCDVLHAFGEGRNHVALITDIFRDENGKIAAVEISEAIRPHCVRRQFATEDFYQKWNMYSLFRYEYLENVPLFDDNADAILKSGIDKKTPRICVDYGDKSNYLYGEQTIISVFGENPDTIEVYKNGEICEEILIGGRAVIPRALKPGYYVLNLKNAGDTVEFAVNRASLSHSVNDGNITVCADACDTLSEIEYFDFREKGVGCASLAKYFDLSDEEKRTGTFTREIPEDAGNYKVYFRNKYGVWVHPMIKI